jgi:hypothetical protein
MEIVFAPFFMPLMLSSICYSYWPRQFATFCKDLKLQLTDFIMIGLIFLKKKNKS